MTLSLLDKSEKVDSEGIWFCFVFFCIDLFTSPTKQDLDTISSIFKLNLRGLSSLEVQNSIIRKDGLGLARQHYGQILQSAPLNLFHYHRPALNCCLNLIHIKIVLLPKTCGQEMRSCAHCQQDLQVWQASNELWWLNYNQMCTLQERALASSQFYLQVSTNHDTCTFHACGCYQSYYRVRYGLGVCDDLMVSAK